MKLFSPPDMTIVRHLVTLSLACRTAVQVALERVLKPKARRLNDVPGNLDAVTAEWMSAIICKGSSGAQVIGVESSDGSSGTSERARYSLSYNQRGIDAGLPETVFAKASPSVLTRMSNGVSGTMEQEGRFYNELRASLPAGVEAPKGYHSAWDMSTYRSIHVLEDLVATKNAIFCDPTTIIDRAQAEQLVTLLATLHGHFYDADALTGQYAWLKSYPDWWHNNLQFFDIKGTAAKGILRAEPVLPTALFRRRDQFWRGFLQSVGNHYDLPQTLLHGDVHMGNWYITGSGKMGLCDWQCVSRGHWSRDLAYALGTTLTIENRRAWERDLLAYYLDVMGRVSGVRVSFDVAWDNYRLQLFGALMMWAPTYYHSIFLPDMQPDNVSEEMLKRIGAALDDLDSLSLIEADISGVRRL